MHVPLSEAFVDEVSACSGVAVQRVVRRLREGPVADGFILCDARGADLGAALSAESEDDAHRLAVEVAPRTVLVNVSPSRLSDRLLKSGMPAAIDANSMFSWARGASSSERCGIYGRYDVGVAIGATCDPGREGPYAFMWKSDETLPALLAAYLLRLADASSAAP